MKTSSPQNFYGHLRSLQPITEMLVLSSNNKKDRKKYNNESIIEEILKYDKEVK